jgi:hypothetical protein
MAAIVRAGMMDPGFPVSHCCMAAPSLAPLPLMSISLDDVFLGWACTGGGLVYETVRHFCPAASLGLGGRTEVSATAFSRSRAAGPSSRRAQVLRSRARLHLGERDRTRLSRIDASRQSQVQDWLHSHSGSLGKPGTRTFRWGPRCISRTRPATLTPAQPR